MKPTTTIRWPLDALIGAPVSWPRSKAIEMTTGMPAATSTSASRMLRRRVTKADPVWRAAYAVLKGQLPVPS